MMIKRAEAINMFIRQWKTALKNICGFLSRGTSYGLRKMFHWLAPRLSFIIKRINPMMIMTTEVPLPFLMVVLSMKESVPIKRAGTIACRARFIGGMDTMARSVSNARINVMTKQMTYEIKSRNNQTL